MDLKPTRLYRRTGSLRTSNSKQSSVIRIQPPANAATNQEARTENRHQHFVGGDDHELICTLSFYSYATHISRYCFLCLHCISFLVCTACNLHFFYLAQPSGGNGIPDVNLSVCKIKEKQIGGVQKKKKEKEIKRKFFKYTWQSLANATPIASE